MDYGIAGKRALVLGASRGLGAAIAKALAAEGVQVIAAARSTDTLAGVANIEMLPLDLSDKASIDSLIKAVQAKGGVDILVNNCGGPKPGPAQGRDSAEWIGAFETMAASIFAITDAFLPGMIEKKWGRIVTVGSSGMVQPIPSLALSNGIRGAIAGWSKTLATEVAKHGVTVNVLLPGRVATDRVRQIDEGKAKASGKSFEEIQEASKAQIPAGRFGDPEEFGAVGAFLCSQAASYVTGAMIPVDGGMIKGL